MSDIPRGTNLNIYVESAGKGKFQCMICDKLFKAAWSAKRHIVSVHAEVGLKPCPDQTCTRTFRSPNQARTHAIQVHGEKQLLCPSEECGWLSTDIYV